MEFWEISIECDRDHSVVRQVKKLTSEYMELLKKGAFKNDKK